MYICTHLRCRPSTCCKRASRPPLFFANASRPTLSCSNRSRATFSTYVSIHICAVRLLNFPRSWQRTKKGRKPIESRAGFFMVPRNNVIKTPFDFQLINRHAVIESFSVRQHFSNCHFHVYEHPPPSPKRKTLDNGRLTRHRNTAS